TQPASAPILNGTFCDGMGQLDNGFYYAGSTITVGGHDYGGELFNSQLVFTGYIGTADTFPFINRSTATDGLSIFASGPADFPGTDLTFYQFDNVGAVVTTWASGVAFGSNGGECVGINAAGTVLYWGNRGGTAVNK